MIAIVQCLPREVRIAFPCALPERAGEEAETGTITRESVSEQASAGLDALSRQEIGKLRGLNIETHS